MSYKERIKAIGLLLAIIQSTPRNEITDELLKLCHDKIVSLIKGL